jgi:hypothetical protein
MTGSTSVIAITKHGIDIANRIMEKMPEVQVYAPIKYANSSIHSIKTYVLDSAFGYFVKKNRNILPDWFTQAIQAK